jgi:hypothetical protein
MSKPVDSILYTCTKCGIVFGFNKDGGMINHEGTFCKRCTRIELSKLILWLGEHGHLPKEVG